MVGLALETHISQAADHNSLLHAILAAKMDSGTVKIFRGDLQTQREIFGFMRRKNMYFFCRRWKSLITDFSSY